MTGLWLHTLKLRFTARLTEEGVVDKFEDWMNRVFLEDFKRRSP